ncbi:DUF6707 family protein [Chitinilyticum litopenaei]|uniref:DUF6707 family protein n=1 Tax=Chitinilyticum litopenaei TaxID=1121276 RepID=UPI0003FB9912|nr:DUF6707 family protein [Chitinilyticum litopenaei]
MNTPIAIILQGCAAAASQLNPRDAESIERAAKALLYAYVFELAEPSRQLSEQLAACPPGNMANWESTKLGHVVPAARLGGTSNAQQIALRQKEEAMVAESDDPEISARVIARRLRGSMIKTDKIDQALSNGDVDIAVMRRITQIGELLFIAAMGGSEAFPASQAMTLIAEHAQHIRQDSERVDLRGIYPFDELLAA